MSSHKQTDERKGLRLEEPDEPNGYQALPPEKIFTLGLIEVEFKNSALSGVETWDFNHENDRHELATGWRPELVRILADHHFLSWQPSFPLQYPWSTDSTEEAREAYLKAGRDRFVTFRFASEEDVLSIAKRLREIPEIKQAVAVPNIAPPAFPPNEPLTGTVDQVVSSGTRLTNQWYLFRCEVPEAWNHATGNGVVIADIDWGFNVNHQDLRFRVMKTRNMFNLLNTQIVSNGERLQHGNAVLGLAGAAVNTLGMAGIAFRAQLWAIQAGTDTLRNYSLWRDAIKFVRDTPSAGRKVIILEIQTEGGGNIEMIASINKEIIDAINAGVVVCVPAGNGNGNAGIGVDGVPIPETGSILVGATRFDPLLNQRAGCNGGNRVVIYAPGDLDHDLTCGRQIDGYLERFGGTSGATAKVAGVVALMLERNPQLSPQAVRDILRRSEKGVVEQGATPVPIPGAVFLDAKQAVNDAIAGV